MAQQIGGLGGASACPIASAPASSVSRLMESNFARSFSTAVAVVVALSWRRQAHQAAAAPSPAALASAVPSDRGSARRQRRAAVGVSWAWSSLAYPLSHTAEFSRKVNPCEATGRLPWCQLHSQACEGRCSGSAEVRARAADLAPIVKSYRRILATFGVSKDPRFNV